MHARSPPKCSRRFLLRALSITILTYVSTHVFFQVSDDDDDDEEDDDDADDAPPPTPSRKRKAADALTVVDGDVLTATEQWLLHQTNATKDATLNSEADIDWSRTARSKMMASQVFGKYKHALVRA